MQPSHRIPGISVPKFINGQWIVIITRANGTEYRVRSTDRQSAFDYINEFIAYHQTKTR
ncbi:MAG: hypothetical protein NC311_04200 [Muribaculaceae bacterium]|nr:hypothetical protein [Muribaculaceae bacterium]